MLPYAELHAHSYYSLLDGASSPDALASRAAELGIPALALTDHDAVYGAMAFAQATKKHGIQLVLGTELTLEGGSHLTLLVENETGWNNLCTLISLARHNAPKGEAALPLGELERHTDGLIAFSGCRNGEIARAVREKRYQDALNAAERYKRWFGAKCFWIELQNHHLPDSERVMHDLVALAEHLHLGYVASNNVHYATADEHELQDVLVCIRENVPLDASRHLRRPNSEYYLKSPREMARLFHAYPRALAHTLELAARCRFELRYGVQDLPVFPTPGNVSAAGYLEAICRSALQEYRLSGARKTADAMLHELAVIERAGLSNYFLIVWDIVRYASENGILCQGRGSAANSLVAYLLGISPINPLEHDLVFERFLSDERVSVPDIDLDFQADRREGVIQYVYERYGHDYAAMACTFVTFRARSAIRDVGKALGLAPAMLEETALAVDRGDGFPGGSPYALLLRRLCEAIDGLPRHLGIHNGGMVITGSLLARRLPTEPATMPGRVVVQWDKATLEDAGMVKVDILGLRMQSAIAEAVALVEAQTGTRPNLSGLTFDDPALFAMMTQSDTIGVFQVESRAQAQTLPRLKPKTFNDLIVSISLIRPGPVQGNMVHPYLRRRAGSEEVFYPHALLEDALEETLGVILFQEQVLKVARDLAGWTAGQGEQLRRALGGKRPGQDVEKLHTAFIEGAKRNDVLEDVAEMVFMSLTAFAGYSFPKSHAAAFAVLVYQSAWLKHYHAPAFYVALLNNQPMGFWSPAVIVNDARRHGIAIRRVDINRSMGNCTVEEGAIRIGFRYVKGMGDAAIQKIERARQEGEFRDLRDVYKRTRLSRRIIENIILCGAMDDWGIDRRVMVWELGQMGDVSGGLDLVFAHEPPDLPPLSNLELMALETQILGLSTGEHLMTLYQHWMETYRVLGSRQLTSVPDGQRVQVAGQVVMHQAPPTAKGFHFITLEDEHGMINVIVRPGVYQTYRRILRHAPLLLVTGRLQREGDIINVLCEFATNLPRLTTV